MLTKAQLEEMELCQIEGKAECWNCSCSILEAGCERELLNTAIVLKLENERLKKQLKKRLRQTTKKALNRNIGYSHSTHKTFLLYINYFNKSIGGNNV